MAEERKDGEGWIDEGGDCGTFATWAEKDASSHPGLACFGACPDEDRES